MKKILLIIIFLGAILRFTAVNWDNFGAFHPDERNISWAVTRITFFSQMNPKFFAYGGLPIYLYRALGEGVVRLTHDRVWLYDWGYIAVVGRSVSATLSTVSILLIFLVGSVYFSEVTGITSAFLLAFSPWAIREAHFQTTETMLVFFLLLLLIISKKIVAAGSEKKKFATSAAITIVWIGIIWGLAMAAKTTALLFGVIPLAAIWIPVLHQKIFNRTIWKFLGKKIVLSIILAVVAGIIFFVFSPYTILDLRHFRESMTYETGVALGRFSVPYTLQFLHTTPYLYQLVTMLWQAGPVSLVGLGGLILMVISQLRKHSLKMTSIIFLVFPILYFSWVGDWYAKFSRYNVPLLPFITIAAAWLMVITLQKFPKKGMYWFIGLFVYLIIGLFTLAWGLANFSIYLRPQTKVTATQWIVAHIPQDALIYTEHWNDGLPLELPGVPSYHRELLTVYDEPDNDTKRMYYAEKLAVGDYIIFSTRRIWAVMPGLQERYPVTSLFYKKLLSGNLGYSEVATFTSFPQLFGIQINDDTAEESVQVFDHPTVRVFQNTEKLSEEEVYRRLASSMGN